MVTLLLRCKSQPEIRADGRNSMRQRTLWQLAFSVDFSQVSFQQPQAINLFENYLGRSMTVTAILRQHAKRVRRIAGRQNKLTLQSVWT